MQETNSHAVLKKLTVQQLEMIFIAAEISTRASSHGSSLPFLHAMWEAPQGPQEMPCKIPLPPQQPAALLPAQHAVRRAEVSKPAHRPRSLSSLNQALQPSLALLKYFGGDVSTWAANTLVALLPQATSVPTAGRGTRPSGR